VIIWLASYPRSGNTLLRVVLNRCFEQLSQSIYHDDDFRDPLVRDMVGHEPVGDDPHAFIRQARVGARTLYVKTHELPGRDKHPAIYVVRDGRSAVASHTHYLKDILGKKAALQDVISGKYGVSWSEHVQAWALSQRQNILLVRFEDLVKGNLGTLQSISAFIGQPLVRELDVPFDRLHTQSPLFFRRGSDVANISEISSDDALLFEKLHGKTLRDIGYGEARSARPDREHAPQVTQFQRERGRCSLSE
jgi:hypothetical protein